jgi:hypothetical protein
VFFYMPQICDMGPTALLPLRKKACWGFFSPRKIWRLRPDLYPWTWVPGASMLTTRPPKPLCFTVTSNYRFCIYSPLCPPLHLAAADECCKMRVSLNMESIILIYWYTCLLQLGWHPVAVVHYIYTQTIHRITQWNIIFITIRIHKHNNKNT